jgi:hypothetical protein
MAEKTFFNNQFLPTDEDRIILSFLEQKASPVFNGLISKGYTREAIADGFIIAMNQWRNRK